MGWDLLCILQMGKPNTFPELATKAYDMEVTIAKHCGNSFIFTKLKKDKVEFKRNVKFSKDSTKEAMSIFAGEPIQITRKPKLDYKKSASFKDMTKRHPTLKEDQENTYSFSDSD